MRPRVKIPTQTSQNSRTLTSFAITLLDYPRWVIDREVDFTNCRHNGSFDAEINDCVSCRFADACRWLTENDPQTWPAMPFENLRNTLDAAIRYFESTTDHEHRCHCDTCAWLRNARRFKKTRPCST